VSDKLIPCTVSRKPITGNPGNRTYLGKNFKMDLRDIDITGAVVIESFLLRKSRNWGAVCILENHGQKSRMKLPKKDWNFKTNV